MVSQSGTRPTHTWFAAALFLSVTAVGEAWHLVPGNGHHVRLGNRYLSVGMPWSSTSSQGSFPGLSLEAKAPSSAREGGGCVLCHFRAQGKMSVDMARGVMPHHVIDHLGPLACHFFIPAISQPFGPRGPPLA